MTIAWREDIVKLLTHGRSVSSGCHPLLARVVLASRVSKRQVRIIRCIPDFLKSCFVQSIIAGKQDFNLTGVARRPEYQFQAAVHGLRAKVRKATTKLDGGARAKMFQRSETRLFETSFCFKDSGVGAFMFFKAHDEDDSLQVGPPDTPFFV